MNTRTRQKGAALIIGLLILVVVTIIGLTSMNAGVLELRMASNDELRVNVQQIAQGVVDWVAEGRVKLKGNPGDITQCSSNYSCSDKWTGTTPISAKDTVVVRRIYPASAPPPRMRSYEYSVGIPANFFQVEAQRNQPGSTDGYVRIVQGMMLLEPGAR